MRRWTSSSTRRRKHTGLWQTESRLRGYVLSVYTIAVTAAVATAFTLPVTRADVLRFAVLACCAAVYLEITRRVERQREYWRNAASPYLDTKSVWSFAALLVLPPALASAMVVWTYALAWWRICPKERPVPLYRWAFSGAAVLCGTQAAVAVLAAGMHHYPGIPATTLPAGPVDLAVIAAAAALRWAINTGLVLLAILLSDREAQVADLARTFPEHLLEAGSMGLGLVAATLVVTHPLVLTGVVLALVATHRGLLVHQYQRAARTDAKTGLATAGWWHDLAEQALARARDRGGSLGVLIVDIDHFKQINDRRGGHLAGDRVLAAVAEALRTETRDHDLCGRWGGDELVILTPDIGGPGNLRTVADRIRNRIRALDVGLPEGAGVEIRDLTVSIGAATYPASGVEALDDLLQRADTALYEAKNAGRDRTCLAGD